MVSGLNNLNLLGTLAGANSSLGKSQLSLSTGKSVNSVLDGPSNYGVARRAESSMRNNTAGNNNSRHSMDVIDVGISLLQDMEADLLRLQEISFAYQDTTLSADELVAIEMEAGSLADKWDGDASIANYTYNGYNFWDGATVDFANTSLGEGTTTTGAAGGTAIAHGSGVTTITTQSPGTIWALTGIAAGTIVNDGAAAPGGITLDTGLNETALQATRFELMRMASLRSTFNASIETNNSAIASEDGVRGRAEDVDIAAKL